MKMFMRTRLGARARPSLQSTSVVCKSGEVKEHQLKPNQEFSVGMIVKRKSDNYGERIALIIHINSISSVATMLIGSKGDDKVDDTEWGCEEQVPQEYTNMVKSNVCLAQQKDILLILGRIRYFTSIEYGFNNTIPGRLKVSKDVLSKAFEFVCAKAMADHPKLNNSNEAPSRYMCLK